MSMSNVISEVRAWITPTLIVIVGYLAKGKLEGIESQLGTLQTLQTQMTINTVNIEIMKDDLNSQRLALYNHLQLFTPEQEITIKKHRR